MSDPLLSGFLDSVGTPVVKSARGGYDGRGVSFPSSRAETLEVINEMTSMGSGGR